MNLTDSHTHLDSSAFDSDENDSERIAVVERALAAGVTRMITVGAGDGIGSTERAISLAEKYDFVWATAGVHPHDAGKDISLDRLTELAKHPRVVAIGETGLDFFRDWAPVDRQHFMFEAQIGLALQVGKPLIIHSRNAGRECFSTLKRLDAAKVGGVFHCFAENAAFAAELRELNFLVSFPGPLTFKKSLETREICKAIPLDQIMVETDAPYMAPEPYRGKRCEPAFVVETARQLAAIKGLTLEEVATITTANALKLFSIVNT